MPRTTFVIRAEHDDGFEDLKEPGETLIDARIRFEELNPMLAPFDWRGAVVFCDGRKPAEERD